MAGHGYKQVHFGILVIHAFLSGRGVNRQGQLHCNGLMTFQENLEVPRGVNPQVKWHQHRCQPVQVRLRRA